MFGFGEVSDDIERCVKLLRRRAADHRDVFDRNETATRVQLIDPMLRAMGWEPEDPSQVRHEHRVSTWKLDYALCVSNKPVAIVEAKSLGIRLGSRSPDQLMRYAMEPECRQLEAIALTNGLEWVVHRKSKNWANDAIDLSQGDPFRASFKLSDLMHRSQFRDETSEAVEHRSHVEPETNAQAPTGWWDLSNPPPDVSGKRVPTTFIDHRGTHHRVGSWADFYRTAVNALIDDQKITKQDCPIKLRPNLTKCLINDTPYHPSGRRFKKVRELHGGLFYEGNFGATGVVENLSRLLEHARLPLQSIKFKFDPD